MKTSPDNLSSIDTPIDAVITWVDGACPKHHATRQQHQDPAFDGEPVAQVRWAHAGELDICLRSIGRNADFIRHIYIVTDNQTPPNLNKLKPELRKKIKLINHQHIFRDYEEYLPTFNSMAIESMLWRIEGLAENFIYFNDDTFVSSPCQKEDFFQGNKIILRGKWHAIPIQIHSAYFNKKIYRCAKLNAAKAFDFSIGGFFSTAHVAMPMRVSILQKIFEDHPEWLIHNASARFRAADQFLVQGLFAHAIIKEGLAIIIEKNADYYCYSAKFCAKKKFGRVCKKMFKIRKNPERYKLICINDLALLKKRFGRIITPIIYWAMRL